MRRQSCGRKKRICTPAKKEPELIYDIEVGADEEGNPGLYYIDANTAEVVFELVPHKKTGEDGYPIKPKKLLTSKEVAEAEERLNKFISKKILRGRKEQTNRQRLG